MASLDASGLKPLDASGLTEVDDEAVTRDSAPAKRGLDTSGLKPLDVTGLKSDEDNVSLTDYPIELGKSAVEGFKNLPASAMKGTGALAVGAENRFEVRARAAMDAIDRGEAVPDAKLMAGPRSPDQADVVDELGYQYMTPDQRRQARARVEAAVANPKVVTENPLFKAGDWLEDFGKEALGPRPGFEGRTWTRDIGSGFGSVGAGIITSMVNPHAAMLMFVTAGSGEAADRALKAGATPEQVFRATQYGSVAGATDVVDALLPALGGTGKALGFIKRVGYASIAGALAEGGQEGLQQFIHNAIAKGIYKPDQDLTEDVARNIAVGMIVGGTTAGGFSAAEGRGERRPAAQPAAQAMPAGAVSADTIMPAPVEPAENVSNVDPLNGPAIAPGRPPVSPAAAAPDVAASPIDVQPPAANPAAVDPALAEPPVHGTLQRAMRRAEGIPADDPASTPAQMGANPTLNGEMGALIAKRERLRDVQAQVLDRQLDARGRGDEVAEKAAEQEYEELKAQVYAINAQLPKSPPKKIKGVISTPDGEAAGFRVVDDAAEPADRAMSTFSPSNEGGKIDIDGLTPATPVGDGSRAAPVQLEDADAVHHGAERTATPTPAQAEAGNYSKRHVKWNGLDLAIETEAGQDRKGVGADGTPWSTTLQHPYGYIKRTVGKDGDQVDVYVGPNPDSGRVFAFDQVDPDSRKFDEHKLVIGARTVDEAISIYEAGFNDGSAQHRWGSVTEMSVPELKSWLDSGDTKKPLAFKPEQQPRARNGERAPPSLFQFLASKGGIRDHGGELSAIGLDNRFVPGHGRLIRSTGMTLDQAREAAVEAGYLDDGAELSAAASGGPQLRPTESTIVDLLDALDREHRGDRVFAARDQRAAADRQDAATAKEQTARAKEVEADVRDLAKQIKVARLTDEEVAQAVQLVLVNNADVDEALAEVIERAALAATEGDVVSSETSEGVGDGRPDATAGARQDRAGAAEASEHGQRPDDAGAAGNPSPRDEPDGAQHARRAAAEEAPAATDGPVALNRGNEVADERMTPSGGAPTQEELHGEVLPSKLVEDEVRETLAGAYMDMMPGQSALDVAIESVEEAIADGDEKAPDGAPWKDVLAELHRRKGQGADATINEAGDLIPLNEAPALSAPEPRPEGGVSALKTDASGLKNEPSGLKPAPTDDDLEIPDFLRRTPGEKPAAPAPAADTFPSDNGSGFPESPSQDKPGTESAPSSAATPTGRMSETDIKLEADRRWRNWTPSREFPNRPRKETFIKIVRKEQRKLEREAARARAAEEKQKAKEAARLERKKTPEQRATEDAAKLGDTTKVADKAARAETEDEPAVQDGTATPQKSKSVPAPDQTGASAQPSIKLADALFDRIAAGKPITAKVMQDLATEAYGSKLSEGQFDRKDLTDALELAVNMHVAESPDFRIAGDAWQAPVAKLNELLASLPTQRVRNDEMVAFDQFSTPPNYAAAAVYAANLRVNDVFAEPSAGTGSIVAAALAARRSLTNPHLKIIANELSDRRAALLRHLMGSGAQIFTENAEQLDNVLPADVKPTVVVMNPPFSSTAGRMGDKKDQTVAAQHIEQALNRLEPGGRLVAIVGEGMTMGAPKHRAWFAKIGAEHTIRASISVAGKVYEKYGTTFGTRVYVIDKVAPTGEKPIFVDVQSVDELMRALEPIREQRPQPAEPSTAQPQSARLAEAGGRGRSEPLPASDRSGGLGAGRRSAGRVAEPGETGAEVAGGKPVRLEDQERADLAADQSERAGARGTGAKPADGAAAGGGREASGSVRTERDLEPSGGGQPGAPAGIERIDVETAAPTSQKATAAISESLYDKYEPKRAKVKGAKAHPGPLVESASMASVDPPPARYAPHFPRDVIDKGQLSSAQLEPVIYAGQAHEKMLPAAEGETAQRRGFFIGDGTGVGKGREIAGIILDNFSQGRTKAVWVSEKRKLLNDAQRDWKGLGQNHNQIFNAGKVKTGEPITAEKGIAFITYDTLKGGMSDQAALARGNFVRKQKVSWNGKPAIVIKVEPGKRGEPANVTIDSETDPGIPVKVPANQLVPREEMKVKSRVDQLVDWFGKDFDGVIAFDEAHNMGNASATKGERGNKDAAQKALAGLELQKRLPNARVVYVSATGATEVSNLAYAERLGLWGRGTPFASRDAFVSQVEEGGIAAMELIARDMKQLGLYTARNLSYDGVEYQRIEHKLDANQREIYDTLAEGWQVVLQNINKALELTGAKKDSRAKSAAMSAFWGGHQRFFNQIVTSLQMPSVIKAVEADLKAGRQAVLQLTNTNEASQERAAAKAETAEEIEDLDITPRDQIIQLIEHSFPTQQYETYTEGDKVRSRPVVDKDGNPVQNRQAVAMREALIERLASIRVPQGPLDLILDHFGHEVVAEVTGRGRRFILKADEKTGERKRMEESRPASSNQAETDTFQAGKKKVLVFSDAGGTGASYHADNTTASKDARRSHYLVQGGWRADKAVQGFGRTHRTNQASAPIVALVTTDLQGQKRFISSIARRLAQLGALTKGQRQAGDQGIFSARDNLESTEAHQALRLFYGDILAGNVEGVTVDQFEQQTGLKLRNQDEEGRSSGMKMELPPITQFLNRLLSLKIDTQNAVFEGFSNRLDAVIEARAQAGLLDAGLETVRADRIEKASEKVVHTIEESGAQTKYVKVQLADKFTPIDFADVASNKARPVKFWLKSERGKVYAGAQAPSLTDEKGNIVDQLRIINPVSGGRTIPTMNIVKPGTKWVKIDRGEAQRLWKAETDAAPEYVTRDMHLITGAILPIWDRIKGSTRVVRLQTDEGDRFIGRVVPSGQIAGTLKALGAEADQAKLEPGQLFERLMAGDRATLANGWTLTRRLVAGEQRIELKGPANFSEGREVEADGVFSERIDYVRRYFVPTGENGADVLKRLTQFRPVTDVSERGRVSEAATDSEEAFKLGEAATTARLGDMTLAFAESVKETHALLRAELDRVGLPDVALKLQDRITRLIDGKLASADATYLKGTITMALDTSNKFASLHHEALHGLRRLGLFTDGEWSILERSSNARWRQAHDVDTRYAAWPEWVKIEEGVAHAYAAWADGKPGAGTDGRVVRLFKRIQNFFEATGNALRGQGFKTAEDIFASIDSGAVGRRLQPRDVETGRFATDGAVAYAVRSGDGDLFKTEVVNTPDGPRQQGVIPGAEQISQREQLERKGAEPKRSGKTQKGTEELPLFREPDRQGEMFALRRDPETAIERQNAMQGFLARGQFIDRAIRVPFDWFGGTTRDGQWKPGIKLFSSASHIITTAKFDPESRFAFINPIMEVARAGLVDRYGLDPAYVERERARSLDERAVMLEGSEILRTLKDHSVGSAEAKVLQAILTGESVVDSDMEKLAEPIRQAIDQLGEEAVALGLVSPESFERNRGTYLHRVYKKHEADQNGLSRMVGKIMSSRRKKIIGDQFRSRGLFQEVALPRLMKDIPDWHAGARGTPVNGERFTVLDEMPGQGALAPIDEPPLKPGHMRLYRGESAGGQAAFQGSAVTGGWFTTDRSKAERYGAVKFLDVARADKKTLAHFVQGHGGADEYVTDNKALAAQAQPLATTSNVETPLRRIYWPAGEAIPDRYAGFRNQGTWEVRGGKGGKITLWRDFTKPEREQMGEILDARYTIGKTFMLMAHDLSVGKFYKDIAENEDWASSTPPAGKWLEASDWNAQGRRMVRRTDVEWVKVPEAELPDSGGKKRWGALSGKFVREEIWRDLNEIAIMNRPNVWRTLLTQWKLNKTARSPVVHMNNVMSNFLLMDMMDVRMQDLAAGVRSYLKGDQHYQEALQHGAFGADAMSQEVRDQVLRPILDELMRENTFQQAAQLGALGQVSKFTELLWSKLKAVDQKMIDAYRAEDEFFRMATFIRRRQLGDDAKQAADTAREQFIDYDIRAPWVNAARNTVLPFISYTYRAAPIVAKAVATRPWKIAKYAALAYAANAFAYALTGGDEDKERRSLREREAGRTWLGARQMMRMPLNDRYGNPIFLDINRWIPGGDIFDTNGSDWPAWLNLSGPLMIGAELFLNRSAFTGQQITNSNTDDFWDRSAKRADHLYKSWVPSAAYVPGSWYWEKVANAMKGATDRQGHPYSTSLALASSVGIKLKPQDVADAFAFKAAEFRRVERALREDGARLSRQYSQKMVSPDQYERQRDIIVGKIKRNATKARETLRGDAPPAPP